MSAIGVAMPPIEIQFNGDDVSRKLNKAIAILNTEVTASLVRAMEEMISRMKILMSSHYPPASSPGQPPAQRTGALWDSIDIAEIGYNYVVGEMLEYGLYLDSGTSKILPRPFFTPVLAEVDDIFPHIFFGKLEEAFL